MTFISSTVFFFNDTATTEIYTLSLHDALPISLQKRMGALRRIAQSSRPVLGAVFFLVGLAIYMRWHLMAEIWLLDRMPIWLQDLSVSI